MTPLRVLALALAALALGVLGYDLRVDNAGFSVATAVASVAVSWAFVAAGLAAWVLRPANRMGILITAVGFALLLGALQYSESPALFTIGFLLGDLNLALFAHAVLAYPSGRITDRADRALVLTGYVAALTLQVALLVVFVDPRRSPLTLHSHVDLWDGLRQTRAVVVFGILAAVFVLLIARRFVRATRRGRRVLAPLLLAALVAAFRATAECITTFVDVSPDTDEALFWWQFGARVALPVALLVGLVSSRLAAAQVADLVRELDRVPPERLSTALARTLADPTLQLALWSPAREAYVDANGHTVELPAGSSRRVLTPLDHEGRPVAALVHDPSLLDDPELLEAAAGAARLALENAQLHAEVLTQVEELRESRARIVAAGDEQRRRIERDLHDGAQQRLVALALELRAAQLRHGGELTPELDATLLDAVDQLRVAVSELRELARGVHPAILTEEGLAAALESLAQRTPLSVTVAAAPRERLPEEIEAAAYFVACEALANAVKHAGATAVTITAEYDNGTLVIEVEDDGTGGADPAAGSGIRGLADRVAAHGGSLRIESAPGQGTRVTGELPCAS